MPDAMGESQLQERGTVVEIRTTLPGRDRAEKCAHRLIAARLAACVQIDGPVTSIYRWQGTVETAEEFCCTCKTSPARALACEAAILATHDYATPELIVTVVDASPAYAAWVRAEVETKPGAEDEGDADRPA